MEGFYTLNLQLPQLFSPNFLRPINHRLLRERTKSVLSTLVQYKNNYFKLSEENYKNVLKLLIEIEDSLGQIRLIHVRLIDRQVRYMEFEYQEMEDYHIYHLFIKNQTEIPQGISEGDFVIMRTMIGARFSNTNGVEMVIGKIDKKFVRIQKLKTKKKVLGGGFVLDQTPPLDSALLYEVKFRKDQTTFKVEIEAVHTLQSDVLTKVLFPDDVTGDVADPSTSFEWFSEAVKKNPEQQQAVRNIVNGSAYPAPYILFGPPGTGKTTTLVEAIAQIYKVKPDVKMLVCASSNSACNEILSRLMDAIHIPFPEHEILRYFSRSQLSKVKTIDKRILNVSNIKKEGRKWKYDTPYQLQEYKLIFVTLVANDRLIQAEIPTNYFDYIFIDEAGSATEPSTIIPISNFVSMCNILKKVNLVIAGDPKQLGPVIMHKPAERLQYGRSLLERLMEREMYKRNLITNQYNPSCITKLLQNFRSHNKILTVPNKLFYDNELVAKVEPIIRDVSNEPIVPVLFHAVSGETSKHPNDPSLYNKEECDVVVQYVKKALKMVYEGEPVPEHEIGVISPYKKQCSEISKVLHREMMLKGIEVGTVEQFQGQERCVIILSTVRSNTSTIGFLDNPKRLNVSITRAKALLIVVGNPATLQLDKNWYELIKYCKEQNSCKGMEFNLTSNVDQMTKMMQRVKFDRKRQKYRKK